MDSKIDYPNSYDYHNYPTAPRNYPLNYQNNSNSNNSNNNNSNSSSSDNYYYGHHENLPRSQNLPRYQDSLNRDQNLPRAQNLPRVQNLPRSQNLPSAQNSLSRNQDSVHRAQNLPRFQDNLPRVQNSAENAAENLLPREFDGLLREQQQDNLPRHPDRHSTHFEDSKNRTVEEYHHAYRGGYRPTQVEQGGNDWLHHNNKYYYHGGYNSTYPRGDGERGGGASSVEGEKAPFLTGVEPVRLTPSWEQNNLPKDELNFGTLNTFDNFEITSNDPPRDRYRVVFLVLVLHGVGVLMPWNMFITAKNYFVEYKLNSESQEVSGYATNFLPYIGYASQIPNVLFNWLNVFINMGGNLTSRIVWSLLVEVAVFVVTVVLAMIDSSNWPGVFFWITIASVVILNVAGGIYQNTVYGMAARLPFSYTGAVVLGNNISGTFTALINILAIALAPNIRTSAIYYFITALFVLLACFDTYFALPLNRFYRYHESKHGRKSKCVSSKQRISTPYWAIFKSAFPQLFNVFFVFFVTLAVFPAVLADTCRTEPNFPVSPKYYQAVTCFLTFNAFAMLGNMLPALITWPSPRYLCFPVILRVLLIPAFVLCHFYPVKAERIMPVLIDSDWAYWALSVILGLSSGYYSSLAMMYCPRTVSPEHAPVAGMMGAASLMTGIFTGIVFQIVCSYAVTNITFEIPGYEFPFRNCTDRIM